MPNQNNTCDNVQGILEGKTTPEDPIARYHISQERKSNQETNDDTKIKESDLPNFRKPPDSALGDPSHSLAKQLSEIVKLQAAPDVEIDSFSGDPLEFTYFIKNFKDIIESTINSQSGRLNRLIKYTEGEAKELIKHCVHENKDKCYNKALELLEKEYGNKFKLSCAFMEQLQTWPSIKQNDASAFKAF